MIFSKIVLNLKNNQQTLTQNVISTQSITLHKGFYFCNKPCPGSFSVNSMSALLYGLRPVQRVMINDSKWLQKISVLQVTNKLNEATGVVLQHI